MIVPPRLKRGDKVAIISPSGIVMPERVEAAVTALSRWGFVPVQGQNVLAGHKTFDTISFGGTDEQRLSDLRRAFHSSEIKAVLCSRGGYGICHLLEHLDIDYIRRHPKWLIGFSDISALHAALHRAGVMSIHAPMAKHFYDFGTAGEIGEVLYNILTGQSFPAYHEPAHRFNREGQAQAMIVGGNLAVLSALMGTPFNVMEAGKILFLEDVAEEMYRVERFFYQLRLAGVLPHLAGLVVGKFTRYHTGGRLIETGDDDQNGNMYAMIRHMVEPYDYPVAFDFPIGHIDRNLPLIEGANATLNVGQNVTLQFQ